MLPENPYYAFHKVQVELANPWMLAVYVIAMIAICWHFAYGVWLFAAKWGITLGRHRAPPLRLDVCLALGILLAAHGNRQHLGICRSAVRQRPRPNLSRLCRCSWHRSRSTVHESRSSGFSKGTSWQHAKSSWWAEGSPDLRR